MSFDAELYIYILVVGDFFNLSLCESELITNLMHCTEAFYCKFFTYVVVYRNFPILSNVYLMPSFPVRNLQVIGKILYFFIRIMKYRFIY